METKKILLILILGLSACGGRTQKKDVVAKQDSIVVFQEELQQMNYFEVAACVDTTMFRYFDIDGDGLIDTLTTTVYVKSDTIFINYLWLKQNEIMWHDVITDSYLEALTDSVEREEWIRHVMDGVNPELVKDFNFEDLFSFNYAVNIGLDDLRKKGFNIDMEEYKTYILNYKGVFFNYGHPESRGGGLFIWYEPLQRFVICYQP